MSARFEFADPLPGAAFGATVQLKEGSGAAALLAAVEAEPKVLPDGLARFGGLLLVRGLHEIAREPALLVQLSRFFGPEVEDYRHTLTDLTSVHPAVPEILVVSNAPPVNRLPPKRPDPPLTPEGKLPLQYPQRIGWHTDQSYRRPPPDISLFYAATPAAPNTGQTLFANGFLAYDALPPELKARADGLEGLHAQPGTGRSRSAALAGTPPPPAPPHKRSQRQPVVRTHPVSGRKALYLCEAGQMDWFDGPFVGLTPGPHGEGAALLDELMTHLTQPRFVYAHEWTQGDMLIWDNRCLVHAATWYDHEREERVMWRTTVHGNPGAAYAGEAKSWLPTSKQQAAAS